MRFYVPNMEEQPDDAQDKPMKDETKDEQVDDDADEEITPAKVLNDQILKHAGLIDSAGDIIASFHGLPLQVPRGKYTLDMCETFAKFHGRTHDYKIMYKDILKVFQLPRIDRDQIVILIQLSKPLNQGQTMHHFIMIQLDQQGDEKIKINMSAEEMQKKYGGSVDDLDETPNHQILAKLLRWLAGVEKIIIPGDFKSGSDDKAQAVHCSYKVSEGFLYPLKTSLIFIQKPIIYIRHSEIKYVEFSRIGGSTGGTGRSFDFIIAKLEADGSVDHSFKNVDKKELKALTSYFKAAGVKMRQVDGDNNQVKDMDELNSEEIDEEIRQSQAEEGKQADKVGDKPEATLGRGGRRRVPVAAPAQQDLDDDYDDEDDESFGDEGSGDESEDGDEDGEEEMEDDVDDEIDRDELKALKGNKVVDKKERKGRK